LSTRSSTLSSTQLK